MTSNPVYCFAFLSQHEPKKIQKLLKDEKLEFDAMQEELLQFVDTYGHRQEEGIDYDEVFAPVARLEAIRIFLAFASYMGFIVYQMDVKSAFLYGKIDEEVYVSQPPGFLDPKYPQKVYKVVKDLYGLHQAPRAWYATLSTFLLKNGYRRVLQLDTQKTFSQDEEPVMRIFVHSYRSMIGSLMYLTASRTDIMFAIVTMLEQILTGNQQQEVVNFLAGDSSLNNAKSRPLWPLLLQKQNILLLKTHLGKVFVDSKSNVRLWVQLHEHKDLH
ncbi:putative ribonuclease H-like domain-containing protein [Tanacetum coccineum]|uniref:Ribonuclease H-like domain-containing protein n=1 Tax=Tanacetum coccineum TaxID=301880 RepID=A0ABQ5FD56_9ASTR